VGNKCHSHKPASEKYDDKEIFPTPADEALLDEFFSLLAGIALRLTTKPAEVNNGLDSSNGEVGKL
jgi:hypothetical protein